MYNGRNELTTAGGLSVTHDGRGNLTNDGSVAFGYDVANRLISATGGAALSYDPGGRLYQVSKSGATTRFQYDGARPVTEYNASGAVLRRYVHGPGLDEPVVWYEGSGTAPAARRYLVADERGSIALVTNNTGGVLQRNTYSEFGEPGVSNLGRFQYTGQVWLGEVGLYHYKARAYHPHLGRFLQTDPIGYGGGMNLYAYAGNDPVNFTDPWGLEKDSVPHNSLTPVVAWCHHFWKRCDGGGSGSSKSGPLKGLRAVGTPPSQSFGFGGSGAIGDFIDEIETLAAEKPYHFYQINRPTLCTADDAFASLKGSIRSAPGFGSAIDGVRERQLWGLPPWGPPNPITQHVSDTGRTIVNVTLPDHRFHPGWVFIQVLPHETGGADIIVTGAGVGNTPIVNNLVGLGYFGMMASWTQSQCNAYAGFSPPF